eukprot:COSAG04_NODE_28534_length_275_cov_0.585227_1_plen_59_part_01
MKYGKPRTLMMRRPPGVLMVTGGLPTSCGCSVGIGGVAPVVCWVQAGIVAARPRPIPPR